jgi:hypothetical protein
MKKLIVVIALVALLLVGAYFIFTPKSRAGIPFPFYYFISEPQGGLRTGEFIHIKQSDIGKPYSGDLLCQSFLNYYKGTAMGRAGWADMYPNAANRLDKIVGAKRFNIQAEGGWTARPTGGYWYSDWWVSISGDNIAVSRGLELSAEQMNGYATIDAAVGCWYYELTPANGTGAM